MTLYDKNETDEISDNNDYNAVEQFIEWCSANKKVVALIVSAMVFHACIFIGGIVALSTANSTNIHESVHTSNPASQPMMEPVEEPVYKIDEDEDNIEDRHEASKSDSITSAAYETGKHTGELFNESRDSIIDFLQGLNETTGASGWAREKWDSGIERVTRWIDDNSAADEDIDSNEAGTDITGIDYED